MSQYMYMYAYSKCTCTVCAKLLQVLASGNSHTISAHRSAVCARHHHCVQVSVGAVVRHCKHAGCTLHVNLEPAAAEIL